MDTFSNIVFIPPNETNNTHITDPNTDVASRESDDDHLGANHIYGIT